MHRPLADIPIQRKVRFVILLASTATLLLATASTYVFQRLHTRRILERHLQTQAEIVARNCTGALNFGDKKAGDDMLETIRSQPHTVCASLYLPDHTLLSHFAGPGDRDAYSGTPPAAGVHREGDHLIIVTPVELQGQHVGDLCLRFDFGALERTLASPILLVAGATLTASLLLGWTLSALLQKVISRPILALARTAEAVATHQDYTVRAGPAGHDEIGILTEAFNLMLQRIHEQDARVKDSEQRYRLLFARNPVPMLVHEPGTLAILDANDAAVEHYGYSAEEFRRLTLRDIRMAGEAPPYEVGGETPATAIYTIRHRKRDGTPIYVETTSHLLELPGRTVRLSLCVDVTARRSAEESLARAMDELEGRVEERTRELREAKAAAEQASQAKSRFLAMMSHEIRTPLNGVTGVLNLLQRAGLPPAHQRWIEMAATSARTLLRVLNDVLDFSKVEAGKLELRLAVTELPGMLRRTAATFAEGARAKGLDWRLDIAPEVPAHIETDPDRLAQIVGNLLGNAVKFTAAGSVTLRVSRRSDEARQPRLRFEVVDTGPGIHPDDQGRLFQPFTQIDNSATRRHGGTGLGLGICRQLVELMGGRIGLISAVGQGSTFWFELPLALRLDERAFTRPNVPGDGSSTDSRTEDRHVRGRILLAEDNEINRDLALELVRLSGCSCESVDNGVDAVRAAMSGKYDLVFMDCMMPEMDGYTATRAIRAEEARRAATEDPMPPVTIIAMTANAMDGDREECLAAGMDDYLSKPLGADEVGAVIRKWLAPAARPRPKPATAGIAG